MSYADIDFATTLYGADYITVAFDRDGDGTIDTLAATTMFEIVSAEMDSYFCGKVELPLQVIPIDLKMRCVDIVVYRMCPDAARLTEEKTKRFDAAISWLKMVARGEVKLTSDGHKVTGTHLTNRVTLVEQQEALREQDNGARWFHRDRRRRGGFGGGFGGGFNGNCL